MFYRYRISTPLLSVLFFSVVVCKSQPTTEKIHPYTYPLLKIIFDDSNAQLIGIDSSGNVIENAIVAFQLFVNIKGQLYSEQALGSSLNKAMLELVNKADSNTILYFEHIQLKNATGGLVEAENFQYNLGRAPAHTSPPAPLLEKERGD